MTDSPTGALSERDALKFIAEWRLPTVQIDGVTMSYESAYGSNGARGYMRDIARAALASRSTEPGGEAAVCQYSKDVDMPEYRCAVKCQYAESIEMEARLSRAAGVVAAQAGQSHQEFVEWLCNGGFVQMALSHFGVSTPPPISASKEAATCPHCGKPLIDCKCWGEVQKVYKDWSRTRLDVHDDRFAMIAIDNILTKSATSPAPAQARHDSDVKGSPSEAEALHDSDVMPSSAVRDEPAVWDEFLAALEHIRPIGKRHRGMLKAVKKYRLLGE